jgi:aminoglycoside phosphotransferase (APT) family kinase protein
MHTPAELFDPLRFLIIETHKQLQALELFWEHNEAEQAHKSLARVDYIDNFQISLLNRCADYLLDQADAVAHDELHILTQSYQHLSHSLKELSRQLEHIAYRALHLNRFKLIQKPNLFKALGILRAGLELIVPAMQADTSQAALDICRLQLRIQKLCDQQLEKYQTRLKKGQHTEALLEACFVIKDINQLGEGLLRIGESILSANLGQTIKLERYHSLEETLSVLDLDPNAPQFSITSMAETKSGCTLSGVSSSEDPSEDELLAIFKQGEKHKLLEEKKGIESWNKKFPGIAPKVYSYHKSGNKAALLYEYLTGETFDQLITGLQRAPLEKALSKLFSLLLEIWNETRIKERHPAQFMQQLKKRLKDIYRVHPDFDVTAFKVGNVERASLESLIEQAAQLEKKLTPPKSVYIHGDFNIDNILYDPLAEQISFIDLHRSEYADYVQDLSVFMVSNYRLVNFDPDVRKLIALSMQAVYEFGERYAEQIGDHSYHLRMGLGLARSFLSSTRFILDAEHAKAMHYRGRYLLEQLVKLKPKEHPHYRISKELFRE